MEALGRLAVTRFVLVASIVLAAACGDGDVHRASGAAFEGVGEDGRAATIRLEDYATREPGVLVVRVEGGAWCGTCRWQAAHTNEIFDRPGGERTRVLDLVIGDRENAPARPSDAATWRALVDRPERVAVAADPSFSLRALAPPGGTILPMIVIYDTRTMKVASVAQNPDPAELARDLDAALGVTSSPHDALVDGIFHRNEWDMIRAIQTPGAPPPDPTDEVADDPRAAAFGKSLFFDESLSPAGVSCASCHDPKKDLSDDRALGVGIATGTRKTPRIALAAFSPYQFWDGRADSLAWQAKGPLENPAEMGSSRARVAERVAAEYAATYREIFPAHALADSEQVFADVGKSIEAYERTFRVKPNALDAYAAGDFSALTLPQKQGLSVFAGAGCMQCHWGPRLTDDAFHVTRALGADHGRPGILGMAGAFKTPSLRGVAETKFFGHAGAEATLSDVMLAYGSGAGDREPWLPKFGETTRWSIAIFLETLSGTPVVP